LNSEKIFFSFKKTSR